MSYRSKREKERNAFLNEWIRRMEILSDLDERTDVSETTSGIVDDELEETEHKRSAIVHLTPEVSTPTSTINVEGTSEFVAILSSMYLPTPSTSKLDEIQHLRKQNLILSEDNSKLNTKLAELTEKYAILEETSIAELKKFREEITQLKEEIRFSNEIRTLRFSIPDSWLEEETSEEE